jgi:hypothetical protein
VESEAFAMSAQIGGSGAVSSSESMTRCDAFDSAGLREAMAAAQAAGSSSPVLEAVRRCLYG